MPPSGENTVEQPRDEAFDGLVRRHARLMAAAVRRVCGRRHRELIPDVEQEVYLALWKRLGSGNRIEHPTSYLYKMALTTALAVVRRHEPHGGAAPLEEAIARSGPAARPDELQPVERRRLLAEVLGRLGAEEARALRAYLAGFNHTEVAELFGWSESVARHRIYRSLERLRALAAGEGDDRDERRTVGRP